MRYILSGLAGLTVSFGLFLMMTHLITVETVEIVKPPPSDVLVFVKPEEPKPEVKTKELLPNPPSLEPVPTIDRIKDYPPNEQNVVIEIPQSQPGDYIPKDGDDLIFKMPPMYIEPESHPSPQYPYKLLRRGIEGYVLIENTIDPDGRVVHVEIIESSNAGFESAVKSSVVRWTYAKSNLAERKHREKVAFKIED